jgi:hypothetical protein
MLILYTLLVLLLGAVKFLFDRRAARLERRYLQTAAAADKLLREAQFKPGTGGKADIYLSAKRQYRLGRLVEQRDRYESKYAAWQGTADRLGNVLFRLRRWKGRLLPYTLGAADVAAVLFLADYLSGGESVNLRPLVELVRLHMPS